MTELERRRRERFVSAAAAARAVGVSRQALLLYEQGRAEPGTFVAARHAEALGLTRAEYDRLLSEAIGARKAGAKGGTAS